MLYHHLEVEAQDEIKCREDPEYIFMILNELYACPKSCFFTALWCTSLISRDPPLFGDTPVRQRYRCSPPSEYGAVEAHTTIEK